MRMLFKPALYLLNKLRFSMKFFVIMFITGIAACVLMFALFRQLNHQIEFNSFETLGVDYVVPIQQAVRRCTRISSGYNE